MQDINVTLVQANQLWEDKIRNLAHYQELLNGIDSTDLIILPEMFHTGFSMNTKSLQETMNDSLGLRWLQKIANQFNSACYTSLIINENNATYNRGVFVLPDGTYHIYDKRKRFAMAGEDQVYEAGAKTEIVDYKGWKINLQICYDLRFPENCRNGMENGEAHYDILLYVANWPERRILHWNALTKARAIENQCFVVAVNRVGTDGNGLTYSGESVVYNALGEVQSTGSVGKEQVETVRLEKNNLIEIREKLPFLVDSAYRSFDI